MTEIWKPVVGHEGYYEVSSIGRVRSLDMTVGKRGKRKGRILRPATNANGYKKVVLSVKEKKRYTTVHILMLESFVGPRPKGHVACHANDIPDDNRLENLRWDTHSGNRRDSIRNGTYVINYRPVVGEAHAKTTLRTGDVLRIREASLFGAKAKDLAAAYSVTGNVIWRITSNKTWRHLAKSA